MPVPVHLAERYQLAEWYTMVLGGGLHRRVYKPLCPILKTNSTFQPPSPTAKNRSYRLYRPRHSQRNPRCTPSQHFAHQLFIMNDITSTPTNFVGGTGPPCTVEGCPREAVTGTQLCVIREPNISLHLGQLTYEKLMLQMAGVVRSGCRPAAEIHSSTTLNY